MLAPSSVPISRRNCTLSTALTCCSRCCNCCSCGHRLSATMTITAAPIAPSAAQTIRRFAFVFISVTDKGRARSTPLHGSAVFPKPFSFSTAQQDDRKRHQAQREEYAQQGHHDAQRVRAKHAEERLRGTCALGRGVFGPDAGAALLLVVVERALGLREVRVFGYPDSAGRDTPGTGRGFVERDPLRVEHRPHVVGLVIGHVTQVQKQLGHDAMVAALLPRLRSEPDPFFRHVDSARARSSLHKQVAIPAALPAKEKTMSYIDGFVIAVPNANREQFIRHAQTFDNIFLEFGATRVRECWGDNVPEGK